MNKFLRGAIVGGVAVFGAMMIFKNQKGSELMQKMTRAAGPLDQKTRGAMRLVRENAMRWSASIKDDTQRFARRLSKRVTH